MIERRREWGGAVECSNDNVGTRIRRMLRIIADSFGVGRWMVRGGWVAVECNDTGRGRMEQGGGGGKEKVGREGWKNFEGMREKDINNSGIGKSHMQRQDRNDTWFPWHGKYINKLFRGRLLSDGPEVVIGNMEEKLKWSAVVLGFALALWIISIPWLMDWNTNIFNSGFALLVIGLNAIFAFQIIIKSKIGDGIFILGEERIIVLSRISIKVHYIKDIQEVVVPDWEKNSKNDSVLNFYTFFLLEKGDKHGQVVPSDFTIHPRVNQKFRHIIHDFFKEKNILFNGNTLNYFELKSEYGTLSRQEIIAGLQVFDGALNENPDDLDLHKRKSTFLSNNGRFKESLQIVNKLLEKNPKDYSIQSMKTQDLVSLRQFDQALEISFSLLKMRPDDLFVLIKHARILKKLGDTRGALETYNSIIFNMKHNKCGDHRLIGELEDDLLYQILMIERALLLDGMGQHERAMESLGENKKLITRYKRDKTMITRNRKMENH